MTPPADPTSGLRRPPGRCRRRAGLLRAAALAALAGLSTVAAASGGATAGSSGGAAPGKLAASLAYSRCMRSHGVPGIPDPKQVAGGGIEVSGSRAGMNPRSPVFASAQRFCGRLLPAGDRPTRAVQQAELARMLRVSRCVRAHGISGFPDPTVSPPSSRAGYADVMSNGFVWLAIPSSIDVRAPAFERAAAACNLGLS